MKLIDRIPPFRIHSTLYRTVYVSSYPPYVRVRTILNLNSLLVEGEADVCVLVCGIRSREPLGANPTVMDLVDSVRMICAHIAQTLDRINEVQHGPSRRTIATLLLKKVSWSEKERCFHCEVDDLAEDIFPPQDIEF